LGPLEALADERPVFFYDQLGCGNSSAAKDQSLWTVERYAEELGQVRKALGLSRVHILGQSWGTMLAVDYMLRFKPEGVKSLILSAPCLSASRWYEDQRVYLSQMPQELRRSIEDKETSGDYSSLEYQAAMTKYYQKHLCRLNPWPESLKRTFAKLNLEIYKYMWGPSEFTVTGTLKNYEHAKRLNEIGVPTLFTVGRYDEASPEAAEYYRSQMPAAELVIFEEASHAHLHEKTVEYLKAVRRFLARSKG
jgi:proline iminopeptidase